MFIRNLAEPLRGSSHFQITQTSRLLGRSVSFGTRNQTRLFVGYVRDWQKGFRLTFGKAARDDIGNRITLKPGIKFFIPIAQRILLCDVRENCLDLPTQRVPTSDKATLWVDSAVIFQIKDPEKAIFNVCDVGKQVVEKSQEILRHEFSGRTLSDVLTHRDICEERIKKSVLGVGDSWGVDVKDLILKDIRFPESMERSLGRGAEADAEGQAKLTHAKYEKEAAKILAEAGTVYEKNPAAMKLREMSVQLSMAKEGKGTNTIFFPVHEIGKMLSSISKI